MKELEALKNIAPYVCIPLFVVALAAAPFWQAPSSESESVPFVIRLVFSFPIVFLALDVITDFIFRYATYGNDGRGGIEMMPLPYVIGSLCLAFGIWGLAGRLLPGEVPPAPLNIFWHLGCLAYGFRLL
jgi:hypothetical protein